VEPPTASQWFQSTGELGWRSGESARLPPVWLGFDSGPVPYVGWVCRWFSPCSEGIFPVFWFSFLRKNQHSKFLFHQDRGPVWNPAKAKFSIFLKRSDHFMTPFLCPINVYTKGKSGRFVVFLQQRKFTCELEIACRHDSWWNHSFRVRPTSSSKTSSQML